MTKAQQHTSGQKHKNIVVLASGSGSNFQTLIDELEHDDSITIRALVVDRPCRATQRATQHGIDYFELNRNNDTDFNASVLQAICRDADLIVCAGYLSIIPASFIEQFPEKIINIHPSLLPDFGGAGMYGMKVHEAVIASKTQQSGCTVHYVDSGVDTGKIIQRATVPVTHSDTAETLQQKVLVEEHKLLPAVVQSLLR